MNDMILAAVVGFAFGVGVCTCYFGWADTRPLHVYGSLRSTAAPLGVAIATGCRAAPPPMPPGPSNDFELLIIRCSDPQLWYADKVGQRFPFEGVWTDEEAYRSREAAGYINQVKWTDANVVMKEKQQ